MFHRVRRYMVRLGIWGPGSPLGDFNDFMAGVEKRDVGAKGIYNGQLDMKLRGIYNKSVDYWHCDTSDLYSNFLILGSPMYQLICTTCTIF